MIEEEVLHQAKILIVDDEPTNVRLLEIILLEAGFSNVVGSTDPLATLNLFKTCKPDVLLLDLNMPRLDGYRILKMLKSDPNFQNVPVIVLTADVTVSAKHRALAEGASDFLTKPFDDVEVLLRLRNLLRTHFYSQLLEATVQERTQDLERAKFETVERLALAAEYRDDETGLHARRVGTMSGRIAQKLGQSPALAQLLTQAAPLHDVGKIGIADSILLKPGRLTQEEFAVMKEHTIIGARILGGSTSRVLQLAEDIAMYHHERWDGMGYWGRGMTDIPLSGRIVSVADVFDALTHERPYKKAFPIEMALEEIRVNAGIQFDPDVVDAFMELPHSELIEVPID